MHAFDGFLYLQLVLFLRFICLQTNKFLHVSEIVYHEIKQCRTERMHTQSIDSWDHQVVLHASWNFATSCFVFTLTEQGPEKLMKWSRIASTEQKSVVTNMPRRMASVIRQQVYERRYIPTVAGGHPRGRAHRDAWMHALKLKLCKCSSRSGCISYVIF